MKLKFVFVLRAEKESRALGPRGMWVQSGAWPPLLARILSRRLVLFISYASVRIFEYTSAWGLINYQSFATAYSKHKHRLLIKDYYMLYIRPSTRFDSDLVSTGKPLSGDHGGSLLRKFLPLRRSDPGKTQITVHMFDVPTPGPARHREDVETCKKRAGIPLAYPCGTI